MTEPAASSQSPIRAASDYETARLRREDQAHFVHPFTHFDSFRRDGSLVIAKAHGPYVFDSQGQRYLDGVGGLWCMSIGFGEEEMAEAIAAQVRQLSFYSAFVDTTNPADASSISASSSTCSASPRSSRVDHVS